MLMMMISSPEKVNPLRNELGWVLLGIVFLSIIVNSLQLVISIFLSWRRIKKRRENAVIRIRPTVAISISTVARLEVIEEQQEEESKEEDPA